MSIHILAPGVEALQVPLSKPSLVTTDGVSVWEWCGSAFDEGDEAARWFSNYLGKPARLVHFNEASETRPVDANYATGYKVKFCDGYPFLVLSQGSLDALNALLKDPILVNRFRPKFVLSVLFFINYFLVETGCFIAGTLPISTLMGWI
ncbi:unnamed protein product [Cuscuta campestris]|uniref:Molybdenum cofactor sulfurase middle domain-containing protein n=1 Tax=Cuscuta campestris TaxID=132261 RepID=A0A484MC26_9ASTE|nr:unnamed protein product [Cuscuta campestris]